MAEPVVHLNAAFLSAETDPTLDWKADQNGQSDGQAYAPNGLRYCIRSDVEGTILQETKRHEGVGRDPNSHLGIYNREFAARHLGAEFEGMVFVTANSVSDTVRVKVGGRMVAVRNSMQDIHRQFDATPPAYGCALDLRIGDRL
jgi:hypothetical protein